MAAELNADQNTALERLQGISNVFLTGAAGSGKSFLLRHFLRDKDPKAFPVLATTGAAAILVGGRTFHSFFGLGILEGGVAATVDRAAKNRRLLKRLREADGVVVDEISMLSAPTLRAAEQIACLARGNTRPWGGLRIVAVGDFCQLPPVNPFSKQKEWAFLDPTWTKTEFEPAILRQMMRTTDSEFLRILNLVRYGHVTRDVKEFLDCRMKPVPRNFDGTRLFARRADVEVHNLERLEKLSEPLHTFHTSYRGNPKAIDDFKKHAPIPETIQLRKGALVMLRMNDPKHKWVNGSLGHLKEVAPMHLIVELMSGREVLVERNDFTLLDADGNPAVTASNFPVTLAWALTIHKAQGASLDQMTVDLRGLWEPGQAYVALSRARASDALWLEGWTPSSIFLDPAVLAFHRSLVKGS
ncbi:MAG: AAA family ATPase [Deltaproteobacteria bacterium]|nr:AAA family ATPase [Deltaproteobacteria bacterium]